VIAQKADVITQRLIFSDGRNFSSKNKSRSADAVCPAAFSAIHRNALMQFRK